jgi:class 3 adenylate cyclase
MRDARILVVDDIEANVLVLENLLRQAGYQRVHSTTDSASVVARHREEPYDLILLDLQMPAPDGFAIMEQLRPVPGADFLPVIVVTAFSDHDNRMKALARGARDYVVKPLVAAETLQRIRNYLEVRLLYRERTEQAHLLERRVREQVEQLDRLSKLKRFFSPQLAERIVEGGVDDPLRTHRREITAVSIDLRGFTAFTESAEPEEVMEILHDYHAAIGRLILRHEGTIEFFAGDGIMVLFNDPVPIPDAPQRAVGMALDMQEAFSALLEAWHRRGFDLGMGIGIAQGYATIGAIGFEGRWDYGAIGPVTNLAARLCGEAGAGQVLVDLRVARACEGRHECQATGTLALKGFARPVPAFAAARARATAEPPLAA